MLEILYSRHGSLPYSYPAGKVVLDNSIHRVERRLKREKK